MVVIKKVNSIKDFLYILELRNNSKDNFFNTNLISKEEHLKFMDTYKDMYYIAYDINDDNKIKLGFIGHVNGDIRLVVEPTFRNKGFGSKIIQKFLEIDHEQNLKAQIKIENISSINAFKKAGFKPKYIVMEK